jgi:hypothetical protein
MVVEGVELTKVQVESPDDLPWASSGIDQTLLMSTASGTTCESGEALLAPQDVHPYDVRVMYRHQPRSLAGSVLDQVHLEAIADSGRSGSQSMSRVMPAAWQSAVIRFEMATTASSLAGSVFVGWQRLRDPGELSVDGSGSSCITSSSTQSKLDLWRSEYFDRPICRISLGTVSCGSRHPACPSAAG